MRGGYYRPMWAHRVAVGLGADGMPAAWRQQIVGQSILEGTPFAMMIKDGIDETSVEGVVDSPYIEGDAEPLRRPPLAEVPGAGPLVAVGRAHAHRLRHGDDGRRARGRGGQEPRRLPARAAREVAAAPRRPGARRWRRPGGRAAAGQFRGLAVHESFESYVAQVADVSVEGGKIRVHRVVCAIDCGVCINPAGVEAQMRVGHRVRALRRALRRDHAQGRPRPAGQLPRLSGAAHERDAEGRGPHRRERREVGRSRRAGHAADRARRRQRRLRRDREAAAPASR